MSLSCAVSRCDVGCVCVCRERWRTPRSENILTLEGSVPPLSAVMLRQRSVGFSLTLLPGSFRGLATSSVMCLNSRKWSGARRRVAAAFDWQTQTKLDANDRNRNDVFYSACWLSPRLKDVNELCNKLSLLSGRISLDRMGLDRPKHTGLDRRNVHIAWHLSLQCQLAGVTVKRVCVCICVSQRVGFYYIRTIFPWVINIDAMVTWAVVSLLHY